MQCIVFRYKISIRDVVDLKSRECRNLKRRNAGVPAAGINRTLGISYSISLLCLQLRLETGYKLELPRQLILETVNYLELSRQLISETGYYVGIV